MVSEMKPEVVSSSQNFSLCAPLRNSACTEQHKRFFQLCRQEALNDLASGGLSGRATIIPFWGALLLDRRSIDLGGAREKEGHFHYKNFLRASN